MYTFHALFSENNIKAMSKTFLQIFVASLSFGNLLRVSEDGKSRTNWSGVFCLHSIDTYCAVTFLDVEDLVIKRRDEAHTLKELVFGIQEAHPRSKKTNT